MQNRHFALLATIALLGLTDAAMKAYAIGHFPEEQSAQLQAVLSFALHKNPGIAFNIPVPLSIVLPLTGLICLGFGWIFVKNQQANPKLSVAAFAAIVGALGNAGDRLINGFTTDYLIFFRTSAINISDVLIVLGILGVLWYDKRIPSQDPAQS